MKKANKTLNQKYLVKKIPFNELSYLSQVNRLKELAKLAISNYPINVKSIQFIQHGENTTFKVSAKNGKKYLLRIHRYNYHTKAGQLEELAWLKLLNKNGFLVPNPILSKKNQSIIQVFHPDIDYPRFCTVLDWIDGHFLKKKIKPNQAFEIGQLIADFQNKAPKGGSKHRNYWTANGLLGRKSTFGSIEHIETITAKQQQKLSYARKIIFRKLSIYEKKFPNRMSLIHADLHTGNLILNKKDNRIGAIDFDDSGFGFHVYDLVIPYISFQGIFKNKNKKVLQQYKKYLLDGYKSRRNWDQHDENIFPYLVAARKLALVCWLNLRKDNPMLRTHIKPATLRALKELRNLKEFKSFRA